LNNFHEYLIQHSFKSGGTKEHFKWVKVPGTAPNTERADVVSCFHNILGWKTSYKLCAN